MRRKNMFRRQNSETAKRTCDPDVEVVDSVIGQSGQSLENLRRILYWNEGHSVQATL